MSVFSLRVGLWSSLVVAAVAVYLRFQQPLQDILLPGSPNHSFCYSRGITTKLSTNTSAACFTVKDGVFSDVFTPASDLAIEAQPGHVIPGLWDGVSPKLHWMASGG